MAKAYSKSLGFTIVELLVVIVVIGILAAITIVSYTGINSKAIGVSLQSDLNGASKKLKMYQIEYGVYPDTITLANGLYCPDPDPSGGRYCFKASPNNSFNTTSYIGGTQTFSLTAGNGSTDYVITQSSAPTVVASSAASATGGTITYTDSSGLNPRSSPAYAGGYTVHTFTTSGTLTVSGTINNASVLIVGGGGGGGYGYWQVNGAGAGGGAGAVVTLINQSISTDQTVTIGGVAAGGTLTAKNGTPGNPSAFGATIAAGGGYGANGDSGSTPIINGGDGASGGGGYFKGTGGVASAGYNGGSGGYPGVSYRAGGGGGAGGVGADAVFANSGNGGAGVSPVLLSVTYGPFAAGGGGGGGMSPTTGAGSGGSGIGGAGGPRDDGFDGATNTGSGGGGGSGSYSTTNHGGAGAAGIVIIKYLTP